MACKYKRGKNWVISYFINGKRVVKSLKTSDEKIASFLVKEYEVKLKRNSIQDTTQKSIEAYLAEYSKEASYRKAATNIKELYVVNNFLKSVKKKTINVINQDDVTSHLNKYSSNAPKTYNTVLITLKRFFRVAVQKSYILKNPAEGIHLKRLPQALPRFFTDEEYTRIERAASNEVVYPMIVTARYTGLRLRELLNLEWQDFDWEAKLVRVLNKPQFGHTVKNYHARVVPISDELREKLLGYIKKDGICFPTYGRWRNGQRYLTDGPKRQLQRVFKTAGIERKQPTGWHAFRHTFASRLAQEGTSLKKISVWLGHSSVAVTEIYAHIAPNYDEDIEKLALKEGFPLSNSI